MFTKSTIPSGVSRFAVSSAAISCVLVVIGVSRHAVSSAEAQDPVSPPAAQAGAPIFVKTIPAGYRDWKLISVAHEEGSFHSFAAVLGNDVAIKAYREGKLPFPDGAIIAALHWRHTPSEENNKVFGRSQSFVAGPPTNVQFMIKDAKKYVSTSGWSFGHFNGRDDKPADEAVLKTCYACHEKMKARDLVFTRYAP
jgi:hypothetical protein